MMFSIDSLASVLAGLGAALHEPVAGYCVGFSGGLDSTVLLHALAALRERPGIPSVRAVHIDHGWTTASPRWAEHCERAAARLDVNCTIIRVDASRPDGSSPEAAARAARYAAYAQSLAPSEALVTAHHADDQLETALLQWLRGGGLRALAAMPRSASFGRGWHLRPLLDFPRRELHLWAMEHGLDWLEDPANLDLRFDRSYLRHEILPRLVKRWPAATQTVARVAAYAAEAVELERTVAADDVVRVRDGCTLVLNRLLALPESRQRAAIRSWLRGQGLAVPEARTLAALLRDVQRAADDRVPVTRWPGAAVHRYRGRLFAVPEHETRSAASSGGVRPGERFELGDGMSLEWKLTVGSGLSRARLPPTVSISRRAGGERFHAAGSAHSQTLRKWLQRRGVVPWQRASIPLVRVDERVAAVGDLAYASEFAAARDEPSWELAWKQRPRLLAQEFLSAELSGSDEV
jgi:tRNA(Ile)-lysidine synthase